MEMTQYQIPDEDLLE